MFKNWLRSKIREVLFADSQPVAQTADLCGVTPRMDYHYEGVLNIRVFGATGGTVVEVSRYDKKLDQNKTGVYVIPESDDFSSELSKIVTMEQLKHF